MVARTSAAARAFSRRNAAAWSPYQLGCRIGFQDSQLVAYRVNQAGKLADRVTDLTSSWIEPVPRLGFEYLPTDNPDRVVVEVIVPGIEAVSP